MKTTTAALVKAEIKRIAAELARGSEVRKSVAMWGDRKMYIATLWGMSPALQAHFGWEKPFKDALLQLRKSGDVELCRADLPEVMNERMLQASEIFYPGSKTESVHFVYVDH